jgi:thymidylate synthase (FAD)
MHFIVLAQGQHTMTMDKRFRVELISATPCPQKVAYAAAHQDYSEHFVFDEIEQFPSEKRAGEIAVKRCLKFGHFGIIEHPQIVLNAGWFPHSTMQQLRTHRVISFDCQSFRYTGKRLYDVGKKISSPGYPWDLEDDIDEVIYFRPVGEYSDRQGKRYAYTQEQHLEDVEMAALALQHYAKRIDQGFAEEHARGLIPFDVRQHWVVSMNMRAFMHILTIRGKGDAQLECQQFCQLCLPHFEKWAPQIYEWFIAHQWKRGRLAP